MSTSKNLFTNVIFTNAKIADLEEQIFELSVQLNTYSSVYPESLVERLSERMATLKTQVVELRKMA